MRCLPVLIAVSLFTVSAPFAAAQGFYGSRPWLPSDILQVQPDLNTGYGSFPAEQSAPEIHLLLGRDQPRYRFLLRPVASQADRVRLRSIHALPNGVQVFYALPRRNDIRRVPRHRRRKH